MTIKIHAFETSLIPIALCASLLALPLVSRANGVDPAQSATATDLRAEISTAATHAGIAAKQVTVDNVHKHMHHALNCLVGPDGAGFDSTYQNPCEGLGNGAIADSTDMAQRMGLERAAEYLRLGFAETNLESAQKVAKDTEALLKKLMTE